MDIDREYIKDINVSKLRGEDRRRIAHYLAERSIEHIPGTQYDVALKIYIETFNNVLKIMEKAESNYFPS